MGTHILSALDEMFLFLENFQDKKEVKGKICIILANFPYFVLLGYNIQKLINFI